MTNFNKRICFNINSPLCPTYGTQFKNFPLFFCLSLPPLLLQRTCVQGLSRKWCSSLPESTPGKHHLPSCAKVSVCMATAGLLRPDLLLMHVLGWRKFGSDGRVSSCDRFFPHSEDISSISGLSPAACLLGGSGIFDLRVL